MQYNHTYTYYSFTIGYVRRLIFQKSLKHLEASSTLTCHEPSVPKGLSCCWIAGLRMDTSRKEDSGKIKMCGYTCIKKEEGTKIKCDVSYFCRGQQVYSMS